MALKRPRRTTQTIAYIFSAIVALSMILSLLGPILMGTPSQPTPTYPPTWTPLPTWTPTAPPASATATSPATVETPVAGPAKPLVFAVAGDNRDNDQVYLAVLDRIVQDGNAFLLHTGDMVGYGSRGQFAAFRDLMSDFSLPFYPVPGNHDANDDGTYANFIEFSGAPDTHYSFDVETVHLAVANSTSGHLSEGQLEWLDRDLAATDQPVKMVAIHYPPIDPDGSADILYSGREEFLSLMVKHEVAYVFSGHIHAYSQTEQDGTTYVITAGAGAPLYTEGHPNAFYHYVQVWVEGTRVRTEVVRIDAEG